MMVAQIMSDVNMYKDEWNFSVDEIRSDNFRN